MQIMSIFKVINMCQHGFDTRILTRNVDHILTNVSKRADIKIHHHHDQSQSLAVHHSATQP